MMKLHEYPEIGEKLYSTVLPNGLEIRVIPKKDFSTCYAAFMTNYGGDTATAETGAPSTRPQASRTTSNTRCSTCRTAITR